ncbi:hypothetical protein CPB86DRAFT_871464 [Serendipita vermifera]|nr:hypothetical protein CPB86DRAFT_871464 [Serendipita vermifera]
MSSQTTMKNGTQNTQVNPNGPVVESSSQGPESQAAGQGSMHGQAQNATTPQTVCTHTAPASLANFEFWFEGEDPTWRAAERYDFLSTFQSAKYSNEYFTPPKTLKTPCRTILIMRDTINQEAGENGTAEIEHSPEDEEMDLDDLEASQAAFAAHVAFVFAAYGVDTNQ